MLSSDSRSTEQIDVVRTLYADLVAISAHRLSKLDLLKRREIYGEGNKKCELAKWRDEHVVKQLSSITRDLRAGRSCNSSLVNKLNDKRPIEMDWS